MLLSIVIPVYNSEETIGRLVDRLFELDSDEGLEGVVVDDSSRDNSAKICAELAQRFNGKVVFVQLARNFGEHNATMAGLAHTQGDYVLVMDDDFQNPPETVAHLLQEIRGEEYDVVYSRYEDKRHRIWRNLGSWVNNLVATFLLGKPYRLYLSSFKIMSRFSVDQVLRYQGPFPYIDGLLLQSVSKIGTVIVPHHDRRVGQSSYTLLRLLSLWLNVFTNFSVVPLRVAFVLGLLGYATGIVVVGLLIYERFSPSGLPAGFLMLMTTTIFFSSSMLVVVGLVGEYVGRVLLNLNGKPQFVVRRVVANDPAKPDRSDGPQDVEE